MPDRFQGAGLDMITSAETIESGTSLTADLCIVGAGAAGITLALQFARTGRRVILLISGFEHADAATTSLTQGEVVDAALHPPADTYRERRLGGTTTIWGGRCIPFDPIDFRRLAVAWWLTVGRSAMTTSRAITPPPTRCAKPATSSTTPAPSTAACGR